MNFLNVEGKTYIIFGVANKKSIAWHVAQSLEQLGAIVIYSVHSEKRKSLPLLENKPTFICDVESSDSIQALATTVGATYPKVDGILHSIAFANYSEGLKPFHETLKKDYLQAAVISSFSLIEIANAFKPYLSHTASVVSISISSCTVTADSYGYMSPIKASLESISRNLAKSFSKDTSIRFNTVNAGPLKTASSAGIPGYLNNYLYAEKLTLRKKALLTQEVANTALFLLSDASSGINAQGIVVNAGMDNNYFDQEIVTLATKLPQENHLSTE